MLIHWNYWFVIFKGEHGWLAYSPDIDAFTQGKSKDECKLMGAELIFNYLQNDPLPKNLWIRVIPRGCVKTPVLDATLQEELKIPDEHEWLLVTLPLSMQAAIILKQKRLQHKLTVREMADILGTTSRTIFRWESSYHDIPLKTFERAMSHFGKTAYLCETESHDS